ncbi:RNA-directed DNA polymerase from transposon BS [Paramuricea clavata]|uniref:RNA-directed DNA polymerase from transposon BS n=1 Tax=Paramuricea clavata TaxID=317549 RepID=A0A7D9JQ26_PARCT|nr:RNA-directed DNA polymerase from transposon BS [Paramuricea clavata]
MSGDASQSRKKKIDRSHTSSANTKAVQTESGKQQRRTYPDKINLDESKSKHPTNTVIVGDSILKHLYPRKLQQGINGKAIIKTFPGASIDDMLHYVKPTTEKQPDHIILHIGTNDLRSKSPEVMSVLISAIQKLGESIQESNSMLADKVNMYNEKLENLSLERNWGLIQHNNINKVHLNMYGLHLNQRRIAMLAAVVERDLTNFNSDKLCDKIPKQAFPKSRGFKVTHLNVRSLYKHIEELRIYLQEQYFDIISLNETMLDSSISNHEIKINGYDIVRKDRNWHGGGVANYLRNCLNYTVRDDYSVL